MPDIGSSAISRHIFETAQTVLFAVWCRIVSPAALTRQSFAAASGLPSKDWPNTAWAGVLTAANSTETGQFARRTGVPVRALRLRGGSVVNVGVIINFSRGERLPLPATHRFSVTPSAGRPRNAPQDNPRGCKMVGSSNTHFRK